MRRVQTPSLRRSRDGRGIRPATRRNLAACEKQEKSLFRNADLGNPELSAEASGHRALPGKILSRACVVIASTAGCLRRRSTEIA